MDGIKQTPLSAKYRKQLKELERNAMAIARHKWIVGGVLTEI